MTRIKAALRRAITARSREMTEFAAALVGVPSENPPGVAYDSCVDLITAELSRLGARWRLIETTPRSTVTERRRCVMAEVGGGAGPALYFHGHYDVVPAQHRSQFEPRLRAGRLIGRGSADMKSGLAAMTYAAVALRDCGVALDGRIVLSFVPDEETAGPNGTAALAAAGQIDRNAIGMLTPEPTSGVVWNANRGAITLRVTVHGKPAHVGLQHQGRNAFLGMVSIANRLAKLAAQVSKRRTRQSIRPHGARGSILMVGGECGGGTNFNVVPESMSFTVDRRLNPEEDLATERTRLLAAITGERPNGCSVDVEVIQEGRAAATSRASPLASALSASVRDVTGRAPRFEMCPGLLETRYYVAEGIPALAYGPGLLHVSHGPSEYVSLSRVRDTALAYALTAWRLLAEPPTKPHVRHQRERV